MKNCKKTALLCGLGMMLLPLAACGKDKEAVQGSGTIDKEHVFKESSLEELMKAVEMTSISDMLVSDGKIYLQGSYADDQHGIYDYNRFASVDLDGSNAVWFSLSEESDMSGNDGGEEVAYGEVATESVNEPVADTDIELYTEDSSDSEYEGEDYNYSYNSYRSMNVYDGNFIFVLNAYTDGYQDGEYVYSDEYYIVSYDINGNLVNQVKMEAETEGEYYSVSAMTVADDGTIYLQDSNSEIIILDKDFQKKGSIDAQKAGYVYQMFAIGNKVFAIGWDENYTAQQLSVIENGVVSDQKYELPAIASAGTIYAGNSTTNIYISTSNAIYGWNVEDADAKEVLDYIDSDIPAAYVEGLYSISDDEFLVVYEDSYEWNTHFSKMTKIKPEDVKEKTVVNLACYYLDSSVKNRIIEFNKENENYRVQVVTYSDYDTYDDYTAGITKLNNDIAAGKIPDVFVLVDSMPIESYMEKGLFTDLKKFVEKDSSFSMDDFAPNVVRAGSKGDAWNILIPEYAIQTFVGKESVVGTQPNWTIADAESVMDQYADSQLLSETTRTAALMQGLGYMGDSFIDWKTGNCSFNTDAFISFLEFVNRFPEEISYEDEDYWNDYWQNYETIYRDNRVLLRRSYMSSIADMNSIEKGEMGEKVTFVGFPTGTGTGSYLLPTLEMAISDKSKVKDGAWEFLRYYLTDEYQNREDSYVFPILLSAMDKQVEKATEKPYYLDEKGEKVEYTDSYYLDGIEIEIEPMTKERALEIRDFVLSVDQLMFTNDDITNLITEEAESFFSGQKSAKEVADIIQSRAQIYVSEHM